MSWWLIAAIALITYVSRAAALVFLPRPGDRFETLLARMPAPIFASLATLTLIPEQRSLAAAPVLTAAMGALVMSPKRSLALCLLGGIAGYTLGTLLA